MNEQVKDWLAGGIGVSLLGGVIALFVKFVLPMFAAFSQKKVTEDDTSGKATKAVAEASKVLVENITDGSKALVTNITDGNKVLIENYQKQLLEKDASHEKEIQRLEKEVQRLEKRIESAEKQVESREERIEELVKEKEELLTRIHEMMQKMGASEAMLLKERDDYRKRLEEAEAKVITVSNALKMLEENMNRQQEQKFSD